jgi:hypothetical protein
MNARETKINSNSNDKMSAEGDVKGKAQAKGRQKTQQSESQCVNGVCATTWKPIRPAA